MAGLGMGIVGWRSYPPTMSSCIRGDSYIIRIIALMQIRQWSTGLNILSLRSLYWCFIPADSFDVFPLAYCPRQTLSRDCFLWRNYEREIAQVVKITLVTMSFLHCRTLKRKVGTVLNWALSCNLAGARHCGRRADTRAIFHQPTEMLHIQICRLGYGAFIFIHLVVFCSMEIG